MCYERACKNRAREQVWTLPTHACYGPGEPGADRRRGVYLASAESDFVHGATPHVDGGRVAA
jgi:hypothetical protein